MEERSPEWSPPIDYPRLESPAFSVVESTRYNFQAMLADFNHQYKGQLSKPEPRRIMNGSPRRQKPHRSPFRNDYWSKPSDPPFAVDISSPPATPKRRKTNVAFETYEGDQYQIDLGRLDLCAQVRLLRTVDDDSDEEALTWSSSDDDDEEQSRKLFHLRHA